MSEKKTVDLIIHYGGSMVKKKEDEILKLGLVKLREILDDFWYDLIEEENQRETNRFVITMAQSGSSSNVESKNESGVVCNCNRSTKIVRTWTKDNPGRRFYSCPGRKNAQGYENCNFFPWYDVEKPHRWQYLALLEARDVMREQKEEIVKLKAAVRSLSRETESVENPSALDDEFKQNHEECEGLRREVLILTERSRIFRNVLISTTVGFTLTLRVIIGIWKH